MSSDEVKEHPPGPRCPPDTALRQQRIKSYKPLLDPTWTIGFFFFVALVFIPSGRVIQNLSDSVVEIAIPYDGKNIPKDKDNTCAITKPNQNRMCDITYTTTEDMEPPILVYYKITNFYQNHRTYRASVDLRQLQGVKPPDQTSVEADECRPLNKLGNITINPCGLVANTMFNDVIKLVGGEDKDGADLDLKMREDGIAWRSDIEFRYKQPEDEEEKWNFKSEQCKSCSDCSCDGDEWSCEEPYKDEEDKCHRYFYPEDKTTQYLHETYNMTVSPLEGVTNEHFIVWMRIAMLKDFRKLYGWIDPEKPIPKGTKLKFRINANWEVRTFSGTKTLLITTNNVMGGKNNFLGPAFCIVGYCCVAVGVLFSLKQLLNPRKLADRSYLAYKED